MRARINERLEHATRFPVTLIVAPAGFGKSVALRDFLEGARLDSVRYDVRREDGTLLAFVKRLSEALEPAAPSALAAFPAMQQRVLAAQEPVRQLSDWFAEHLKNTACTIVIDDLHYAATDPASIALLADLIERTGERIKWIIAARSDVGLPIATWIAYGRMDLPVGEEDLRFTTDEALAAAAQTDAKLDLQEVEALRQLTEGWPVALTIAMRTRTHSADLRSAAFSTREMIYRYLAEQVFNALSLPQRAFALASCVFSTFSSEIAQALGATPAFLDELRAKTTFLHEISPGEYRYHELFRDFLEAELRRSGEREWMRALCEGAGLLDRRGEAAGALVLYTKARAAQPIVDIIERHGFSLFERGEAEKVAQALDVLPDEVRRKSAMATGLRGMIDASLGRFEVAEGEFSAAIGLASGDDELRLRLVHRYAIELVRLDRDCVAFLEPYATREEIAASFRVPLLATLATAYLHAGRSEDALLAIDRALALVDGSVSDEARARLYQQAAYVERYAGSSERASSYANTAIALALANDLYELAARAYSVLYTIVHDTSENPVESLGILEKLSECARKGASAQARLFALVASYDIEVERGEDSALERLDREMQENKMILPRLRSTAILPVQALRAAWRGDFAGAYHMLEGTAAEQTSNEQRALRAAETAVYAVAAGRHGEADAELQRAVEALNASPETSKVVIRARILAALAHLLRGHDSAAHRQLAEAERALGPTTVRLRAFANAVRVMYRVRLGQADSQAMASAIARLREEQFGGMARLFEALPASAAAGSYAALTPAEREILQMLARGASTKDVANRTGRSPHTVDTHIRSICRKLSCSGRREAVALATSLGWVEA